MNINNFEENINDIILDRGYDYYNEGNIVETYEQENDEYVFIVEGSEDYEVTVQLNGNGEIIYSDCDCPYDFGPICKHQVAVYFELRDILSRKSNNKETTQQVVKQPELREVLNNLPKEELISIIVDITKKDAALKNSITFRYSKGDDIQELNKCKKLMDSIVKKHLGRGRFIEYDETYDFISDMEVLLEKIRDIEEYEDMLMEKHKDEVIEIYKKSIKLQANSASKRKHYQEVCRILKKFKGVAGKEKLTEMVNELTSLYRKRPAFLDELNKVR